MVRLLKAKCFDILSNSLNSPFKKINVEKLYVDLGAFIIETKSQS